MYRDIYTHTEHDAGVFEHLTADDYRELGCDPVAEMEAEAEMDADQFERDMAAAGWDAIAVELPGGPNDHPF